MPSAIDLAKRSLVGLLKRLATFHVIVLQLNRDASEADVRAAFRNVSRKAHPDRGGRGEDQQKLNGAYEAWQEALKKGRSKPGRAAPAAPPADGAGDATGTSLRQKRSPLGKTAYRARVKNVLKSQKAQTVAKNKFNAFKKTCADVVAKRGAASNS